MAARAFRRRRAQRARRCLLWAGGRRGAASSCGAACSRRAVLGDGFEEPAEAGSDLSLAIVSTPAFSDGDLPISPTVAENKADQFRAFVAHGRPNVGFEFCGAPGAFNAVDQL